MAKYTEDNVWDIVFMNTSVVAVEDFFLNKDIRLWTTYTDCQFIRIVRTTLVNMILNNLRYAFVSEGYSDIKIECNLDGSSYELIWESDGDGSSRRTILTIPESER